MFQHIRRLWRRLTTKHRDCTTAVRFAPMLRELQRRDDERKRKARRRAPATA